MKREPLVIGIHGRAHSGKDTSANILSELLEAEGFTPIILHFADPLKEVAKTVFGLTDWDVNTEEGKAGSPPQCYGLTVRRILQLIGTEMFRELIHQDIWIDRMRMRISQTMQGAYEHAGVIDQVKKPWLSDHQFVFLIPDTRFPNEVGVVKEYRRSIVFEVERPGVISSAGTTHASEQNLRSMMDIVIDNSRSVKDLRDMLINRVMSRIDDFAA